MKEINIKVRFDKSASKLGTIITHSGFEEDDISLILETIGVLENLKQQMLDKLKSRNAVIKGEQ
jgi:hypothetical protein